MEKNLGWSYLDGKRWADISREERFFCSHLYALAHKNLLPLIRAINEANADNVKVGWLPLSETVDWEVGFEVCLFRDWRHYKRRQDRSFTVEDVSLKRTFDLGLFSEKRIVLIEAKAQQGFENDREQFQGFKADLEKAAAALGIASAVPPDPRLDLLLLASGDAVKKLREAGHYCLTWAALGAIYDDKVLDRAERIYRDYRDVGGSNADGLMSGHELRLAHLNQIASCPKFVGRGRGLDGLQADLTTGVWRTRLYEVSIAEVKPNSNWFPLADFIEAVEPYSAPE